MRPWIALGICLAATAPAQEPTPAFSADGVVNAASFVPGLTPGGLATVFGAGLTFGVNGILRAAGFPMPANIQGTMLYINGVAAPLTSIANVNGVEQINFQVPMELAGTSAAEVQVRNGQQLSRIVAVPVLAVQPGIFTGADRHGIIVHGRDGTLVTRDSPAAAGEVVIVYATGLGGVAPPLGTGVAAPADTLTYARQPVTVTFGTQITTPLFAGLTPGFAGLFQINVQLPNDTPPGDLDVQLSAGGKTSPAVLLAVQ